MNFNAKSNFANMLKYVWKSGFDHIFGQFLTYLWNCFLHWNSKSECYNTKIKCTKIFMKFLLQDKKWSRLQNPNFVILQQKNAAKRDNAGAVCNCIIVMFFYTISAHMRRFPEPQHFFAAEWQNWDFTIAMQISVHFIWML